MGIIRDEHFHIRYLTLMIKFELITSAIISFKL